MAIYTVFDDVTAPTGLSTRTTTGITTGNAVTTTVAGGVTAIQFYKAALDTGTHIGMLWTTPDQVLLGQVTFTGESASGWQTQTLSTPVGIAAGVTFTVGIHHLNYNSDYPLAAPVTSGPLTMGTTEFWGTAAVPGYPTPGANANTCAAVDIRFDTSFVSTTVARVSQVLAEVWVQNQPPTAFRVSQVAAEAWVRNPVALSVSQIGVEVWLAAPQPRRLQVSAQVI